jgi:hypothetical protein
MSIEFSKLLSDAQRERLEKTQSEITRLYYLPDRWLACALITMARSLRRDYPEDLGDPNYAASDFAKAVTRQDRRRLRLKEKMVAPPSFCACAGPLPLVTDALAIRPHSLRTVTNIQGGSNGNSSQRPESLGYTTLEITYLALLAFR